MFIPRPKQQEVLSYTAGWMGVSAVPGSGKTETLSRLAAQIVASGQLESHQEVLVVTLVNSAVDNFYRRVSEIVLGTGLLPHLGYRVRTLHGLSHDIVRERPDLVGLSDQFGIIDERVAGDILQDVAAAWLRSHPTDLDGYLKDELDDNRLQWVRRNPLHDLVKDIALSVTRYAKDRQLTPDDLRQRLETLVIPLPLARMGCEMYAEYQAALAYREAVDFDDLMRLALQALQLDPSLLEHLRDRWPFILEDEAQDSSRLQEEMLRLLAGDGGNWVRVGDPNQAIYETFTTADPRFLRDFLQEPGVIPRDLPNSGRSTLSIIALANHLIDWTRDAHPAPAVRDALTPPMIEPTPPGDPQANPPDEPGEVHLVGKGYGAEAEIDAVARSLARWLPEHPESTVAVLVPRNTRADAVVDALKARELDVVESLLRASSTTRAAVDALAEVFRHLAAPTSSKFLADVFRVWRREDQESEEAWARVVKLARLLQRNRQVEDYLWPRAGNDWLEALELEDEDREWLLAFRVLVRRWQGTVQLPADQAVLSLAQDLFSKPVDLAMAHKLAIWLRQGVEEHPEWRLPELADELKAVAQNKRRFWGLGDEEMGFDPDAHKGQVVVATMHKAKGLEWDRVYLMSVNNYDFPSGQPYDTYIAEKWFLQDGVNLQAEALAQLQALIDDRERAFYAEGQATGEARLDYVRERLRLFYVGITRARRELVVTWNIGRRGDQLQSLPFVDLQAYWEERLRDLTA